MTIGFYPTTGSASSVEPICAPQACLCGAPLALAYRATFLLPQPFCAACEVFRP